MAAIRTQNGRVLFNNGKVSCECCSGEIVLVLNLSLGNIGSCGCNNPNIRCYSEEFPAPNPYVVNGVADVTYNDPNYIGILQGPTFNAQGDYTGWTNRVAVPTLARVTGTVGGDIVAYSGISGLAPTPPPAGTPTFRQFVAISEVDCGICGRIANVIGSVDFSFVMYPNVEYGIFLLSSYFLENEGECLPYFRGNLSLGGAAP